VSTVPSAQMDLLVAGGIEGVSPAAAMGVESCGSADRKAADTENCRATGSSCRRATVARRHRVQNIMGCVWGWLL
jgi:hypothetical protein